RAPRGSTEYAARVPTTTTQRPGRPHNPTPELGIQSGPAVTPPPCTPPRSPNRRPAR
ncbi:hypothetical protein IscW_ISCW012373, partial [Ixodes scapularis]